jgi:hypothetical protein
VDGDWGAWLGSIPSPNPYQYTFTIPESVHGVKVQFYCSPGSDWKPVINSVTLTEA